ncbi:cobalamin B12-binding domain-containing protein [Microlunatus flavus]|uniref:B12 binding domain-containing protein n=1 Tax=Microlunatus flavus TaxID=1036181 RepID=A0A1H9EQS1_9ACTN|nr:B12-binding domain-containing protein [Microlunatus flavus]SEQ28054.1 B12 binding domain-containing protein [Microlunatus flavus]
MNASDRPVSPTALPALLLAVQGFDTEQVLAILDDEADRHGLDAVVDDVVFPALRVVGTYWEHGFLSVTHEHLFSAAATRWVYARLAVQPRPATAAGHGRPVLLAAGPGDLHVIGLDCLELLLVTRGVRVCNLGAHVPADALVAAATAVDAAAVVVCSHLGPGATSATASLHAVDAAGLALYYAGSSFDSVFIRRRVPGTALLDSVAGSARLLARLADGPTTDASSITRTRSGG